MWIELPTAWIIVLNVVGIPAAHLLVAWWFTAMEGERFSPEGFLFRGRNWEREGQFYRRVFQVHRWKKFLPDGAAWLRGFAKGSLASRERSYLETFLRETCRGEAAHWVQMLVIFLFVVWNPFPANLVIIGYSVHSNLPCIISQRFTRARLRRVLRH